MSSLGMLAQQFQWPTNLLDPTYGKMILNAATQKEYDLRWAPLRIPSPDGVTVIELLFSADALKMGGVRINVSATLQQQLADVLGAMLPTPKIMDLAWLARAATIPVVTLPIASTSAAMIESSNKLDARIAAAGNPSGILLSEKTWAIGNTLLTHPGKAMNYGDYVIPNQPGYAYSGIATEACVSFPQRPQLGRVIQGQGWAHDPSHIDYSQICWLVHRTCTVNGVSTDLAAVLTDPKLAPLLSHEGVLQVLRQPGVPQFACPIDSSQLASVKASSSFNPLAYGLCPTPAAPTVSMATGSRSAGTLFATASLGLVAGFALVFASSKL